VHCFAGSEDTSTMLQTQLKVHNSVTVAKTPLINPGDSLAEETYAEKSQSEAKHEDKKNIGGTSDVEDACAVCFIGELRNLNETADSIRRNFLEAIALKGVLVDVFVAAALRGPFQIDDFGLKNVSNDLDLAHRIVLRDYRFQLEPSVEEFESLLMKAPEQAMKHYNQTPGNWLGPAFGRLGNALRWYRHEAECLEMMESSEKTNNMRYKWIIRTRPDFLWLAPHPPLSLMSLDMVWTPDTENGLGNVNGRHVVGSRDALINGVLRKWEYVMTGHPIVYKVHGTCHLDDNNADLDPRCGIVWDEKLSKILFEALSIPVGQFWSVAHLVKCPSWSNFCWRSKVVKAGQGPHNNVYPKEAKSAKANAALWEHGLMAQGKSCWVHLVHNALGISQNCGIY